MRGGRERKEREGGEEEGEKRDREGFEGKRCNLREGGGGEGRLKKREGKG